MSTVENFLQFAENGFMDITLDTSVERVLEAHPKAAAFLQERGIVCFVCGEPAWGTLRELVEGKGLDPERLLLELLGFLGQK